MSRKPARPSQAVPACGTRADNLALGPTTATLAARIGHGAAAAELATRLRAHREELLDATLTRAHAIADPASAGEPSYAEGLRATVAIALDHAIATIEHGEQAAPDLPPALLAQARLAARSGIGLDTVLRRYFAGHALLVDYVIQAAEEGAPLRGPGLRQVLRDEASSFDRLVALVSEEHARELRGRSRTSAQRLADRVRRLLVGDLLDPAELEYELGAWHLGVIASGPGAAKSLRALAAALDRRLLWVEAGRETIWAWFGGRREGAAADLVELASKGLPAQVSLAAGEAACGLTGWRLTHQQASSALPIALRAPGRAIRYADVALLASVLRDDTLARSLEEIYLAPLTQGRDGGAGLRQTLKAYFAAGRNVASAAATVGVSRQTVNSRLHLVEELLDRNLDHCAAELETALGLWDFRQSSTHSDVSDDSAG